MPTKLGYFSSVGVGLLDIGASFGDEMITVDVGGVKTPIGDTDLNIMNVERIGGVVVTGLGTMYVRDPQLKEALTIAHYCYVPLAMRAAVNLVRKHLLTPPRAPFRGREGGFSSAGQRQVAPDITFGGGYRPFGGR